MTYQKFVPRPFMHQAEPTLASLATLAAAPPQTRVLGREGQQNRNPSNTNALDATPHPFDEAAVKNRNRHSTSAKVAKVAKAAEWDAADWRYAFEERAGILEYDHGLTRAEAERQALGDMIVKWLDSHLASSRAGLCAWCGKRESPGATVVPFGTEPGAHAWLHATCWPRWYAERQEAARNSLRSMGLVPPEEARTSAHHTASKNTKPS